MDHGDMDHGHGGMDDMCSMSMLFTWDTSNLCIVFKWWHIRTTPGLILSLLIVVALSAGYEALREASRRYECAVTKRLEDLPSEYRSPVPVPVLVPSQAKICFCRNRNSRRLE
jgi:copper transporter 1